ncbi:sigma-70 family RNA polymerase sigma factor [Alteromonas sediminis]|uniref:RNA polymerase sigma factor n=1 Tax=Alteromonas sediminis TaxID=2259342 RepID=A0A3N5XZG1_9ALTE|nr:sigma-70 family RNA polymerase sigma factor [Alteromonas sediminis]RPJ66462.1 sigma-70 family RNA polymerase sigma factor [Alteromonas sediminis]
MFKKRLLAAQLTDADLVLASLGGDRTAFCEIVSRYQSLLCSIAYSAVGDIKHSEDIAQEAFVEAWKKLDSLSDPHKLKAWLCGILRFKVSRFFRKETTQPAYQASDIDEVTANLAEQAKLEDTAIDEQQQQLLWRTLTALPENYREPLVLFYREQKSIEAVATELDLSEEVVKQRLSRGRKQLQASMTSIIEKALVKSKPGAAFTLVVMTSISSLSPPAKASVFSAAALKGSSFFKSASLFAFLAAFSGLISSFFGLRAGLAQSRTKRERQATIVFVALFFGVALLLVIVLLTLKQLAIEQPELAWEFAISAQAVIGVFVTCYSFLLIRLLKGMRALRAQERLFQPNAFDPPYSEESVKKREYKSEISVFGIPLFHFRFDVPEKNDKPVLGWFAGGEHAYGVIFAWGAFAVAPVSVGIVSFGLVSVGAVGIGLLGIGAVGIGIVSFGASAIGYSAFASLSALGWQSAASNGFALAKEGAYGVIAFADEVNNEAAVALANLSVLDQVSPWLNLFIALVVIVPAAWHSRKVRKRLARAKKS